ncbi:hypothetical protein V496_07428 [Pseudogymnoascus sp. VKM F-4515 (FW-2607)]|nr:hypothetical protein V496_07428 [Pseudogymnoascus sp. VKM F-4515 (FW-2607)]
MPFIAAMEVLGAVAAADQLLKETFKLVQLIRTIHGKYQGSPKEIEAWRQEIEDFSTLIKQIETLPTLDGYEIDATIESCRVICRELIGIFSVLDFTASDKRLHKIWMAIKGIDQEPAVRKHFEELQRLKGTLLIKINVSQFTQGYQTAQDVQFIKAAIQPGTEEDQCLKSLFLTNPPDHRDAIITAKRVRADGTCEWITSTDEYKAWITSPPSLLWLSGGPGKGKTFISIFLTKHLSKSANVIYFFCDNKDESRNTAVAILRGLLYQLINQYPRLLHHVFTPWKVQQDALFNSNSFESLWRIFQTMLEELGIDVICVLDGLDECADDSLTGLLQKIKMLFTESLEGHKLRLIILSRRHPEFLERKLGSFARIDLDSDHVSNKPDIDYYITSRVAQFTKRRGISTSLVRHIEETFREKSEDTFLWVSFMADDLEKQTVSDIEEALQTLPKGLDEIYERILLSIKPKNTTIVATMLQWISLAIRPLTVPELAEAMQCEASGHLSKEKLCLSYVESCGHLLQISAEVSVRPTITFVHQSVKDFISGLAQHPKISAFQVDRAQGNLNIACQLLSSMQNEWLEMAQDPGVVGSRHVDPYPLARYAEWSWDLHLQQLQEKSLFQLIDRNTSFFSDSSDVRDKWMGRDDRSSNLLQVACKFELLALTKKLLKRKKLTSPFTFQRYVNHQSRGISTLSLAIHNGNIEITRLLLRYKASKEGYFSQLKFQSALHFAIVIGRLEIFQLLAGTKDGQRVIDADIRAGKRGVEGDSLLHLAADLGDSQMCSLLLERYHYNIEAAGVWGQTPLCNAIGRSKINLARTFVRELGASIAAADKILKAVVKCLNTYSTTGGRGELEFVISECKIDINARDESGRTVLHFAFRGMTLRLGDCSSYSEFVARCLVLGADPSLRLTNGDAPFHLYTWFGWRGILPIRPIILLLRDGRLGVNDQGNGGNTLLHNFIRDAFGHYKFVKNDIFNGLTSLLDVGADRTLVDSNGMAARQLAKKLCDSSTHRERRFNVEIIADVVDSPSRVPEPALQKCRFGIRTRCLELGGYLCGGEGGESDRQIFEDHNWLRTFFPEAT